MKRNPTTYKRREKEIINISGNHGGIKPHIVWNVLLVNKCVMWCFLFITPFFWRGVWVGVLVDNTMYNKKRFEDKLGQV